MKNRVTAGVLAILLGGLGIHKFYLGHTKQGVITLLISLFTFGVGAVIMQVIGIIEGITYLTKTDDDFEFIYGECAKAWF